MKYLCSFLVALLPVNAQLLSFTPGQSEFKLADRSTAPKILVASNEVVGVARAAQDLAWDFGRVVGVNGTVASASTVAPTTSPLIVVGSIGHSSLIDNLISDGKLDVSQTKGKWESYTSQVVQLQGANGSWALAIAGSDRRGAIYGLYDISEQMGVSPWYWWADVPVKTKTSVYVSAAGKIQGPPSVKYRGFFINDESPALSTWVQKKFNGRFGSDFYRLVFELCLRLKGNYMWPAMWGKMFYVDDAKNGQLAHDFGIVMGTSHHEPMARSEEEQKRSVSGGWDWGKNKQNIKKFFTDGIARAKNWETYWTMGMRGSGDAASPTLTASSLEEIIQVQQGLLTSGLNKNLSDIPQTWVLYKEVIDYYAQGLKVPDSVTLLWTDDNSGNLIRVPTASEANRAGGAGVYYHFDYVGSPRNYKWINTIQLAKTWEQMHLAYTKNARQIWLANVGDIKPLEIPLTHFMDMAYSFDQHTTPLATNEYIKRWASRDLGDSVADAVVQILRQYGLLTARRKYELLSDQPFAFSTTNYEEAERNLAAWEALVALTQSTYDSLDAKTQVAFYQLLLHPVTAGKTVTDLYTKAAFNQLYANQGRISANYAAQQAVALFKEDGDITKRYHSLNNGKWDGFVNQPHIGYDNWQDPNSNVMPKVSYVSGSQQSDSIGIGVQGTTASYPRDKALSLLTLDSNMPSTESRWIEIFALKNGTIPYSITTDSSYISFSKPSGSLAAPGAQSDQRILISADWSKVPEGASSASITVTSGSNTRATLTLPIKKFSVPSTFSGFVESNGVVAIEAIHALTLESKNGVSYVELPDYGHTLSAVKSWPASIASQSPDTAPALKYDFYTTSSSSKARLIVSLGASHNHDPTRPLRFAYSIDGAAPKSIDPVSTVPIYKDGVDWRKAVVENGWTSTISLGGTVGNGTHSLSLWLLEPGVIVQKIVVDMGGLRGSALGPYESRRI